MATQKYFEQRKDIEAIRHLTLAISPRSYPEHKNDIYTMDDEAEEMEFATHEDLTIEQYEELSAYKIELDKPGFDSFALFEQMKDKYL